MSSYKCDSVRDLFIKNYEDSVKEQMLAFYISLGKSYGDATTVFAIMSFLSGDLLTVENR